MQSVITVLQDCTLQRLIVSGGVWQVEEDFQAKYEADRGAEQPIECDALDDVSRPAHSFHPQPLAQVAYAPHLIVVQANSAEDVQALGMDKIKAELTKLGLKCGGTLEQRAERLYSVKVCCSHDYQPEVIGSSASCT